MLLDCWIVRFVTACGSSSQRAAPLVLRRHRRHFQSSSSREPQASGTTPSRPASARSSSRGASAGSRVDATEDTRRVHRRGLARYKAVVFLSTTGDVLNSSQQAAFERFIRRGGGFVGVHSAADTEYDWPFYGGAGRRVLRRPSRNSERHDPDRRSRPPATAVAAARLDAPRRVVQLPAAIHAGSVTVLATLDESTYSGGTMGGDHPIMWSHTYEGGRSWYTAGGHTAESFSEPLFADHLGNAVLWAAGAI